MLTLEGKDLILPKIRPNMSVVKKELGARWDKKRDVWRLPPIALNVLKLVEYYGEDILLRAPEEVVDLYEQDWGFRGFNKEELKLAKMHPAWSKLYGFQQEAVEFLFCNPHAAGLLALSPGLGKTAVSVVAADLLDLRRVLVLAPLTLAKAWGSEIRAWSATRRGTRRATASDRQPGDAVTIANHEVLWELILRDEGGQTLQPEWISNARKVKAWIEAGPKERNAKGKLEYVRKRITRARRDYVDVPWQLIIADESVLLKNRAAVKTDVLMTLRKAADPVFWELSGSPTTKFRNDLYRQMQLMLPRAFPSYWRFTEFFCIVDKDGWGWTIEGDRPDIDPHHYLKDLFFARSQEEVLPELPDYIPRNIPLEATDKQRKALKEMFDDWIIELEEEPNEKVEASNWLARSTRLQQITSNLGSVPRPSGKGFYPRSSAKEDLLVDLMRQEDVEYPMLVWCWFVETANSICERLQKSFPKLKIVSVTGKESSRAKDEKLEAYKEGKIDILILQLNIGKWGHTFTNTKTVFYHDRTDDTDAWVQSLRRVRRIGLQHRPVRIIPEVENSADQLIEAVLNEKLPSVAELTRSDLASLLIQIREAPPDQE